MDDSRIEEMRREVLGQLGSSPTERVTNDLASRVSALEKAVAELKGSGVGPTAGHPPRGFTHPSLQVLGPAGGGERCVMEPDKPCVQSHACRTFGH
jgi:hypothetical protein